MCFASRTAPDTPTPAPAPLPAAPSAAGTEGGIGSLRRKENIRKFGSQRGPQGRRKEVGSSDTGSGIKM